MTHHEWWAALKFQRRLRWRPLPLMDTRGRPFQFHIPDHVEGALHDLSRHLAGEIEPLVCVGSDESRNRYLVHNLMEEGTTSSLLEGAATARRDAHDLLTSGREPRNLGERMVVNNYLAMQHIVSHARDDLTAEAVLELHRIVTHRTLDNTGQAGRFRHDGEHVRIVDQRDDSVVHIPPAAAELPARIAAMCDFANGGSVGTFVHPIVRAILLHFWLAYDHPFVDGNGRCARALFYWSMLRQGFTLAPFVSISDVLLQAPVQYGRAYVFAETDDNDLTYFILHQLDVIQKAVNRLQQNVRERLDQRRQIEQRLRFSPDLNERQMDLLAHALRHPDAEYEIATHRRRNGVVYQTARTDLLGLAEKRLFTKHKRGKTFIFRPATDLHERLASNR